MASSSGSRRTDSPGILLGNVKRRTVPTACQNCRTKKVKCDGILPCEYCTHRNLTCVYDNEVTQTPSQARKRRLDELNVRNDEFQRIYQVLAGRDERKANAIFRRIRQGQDLQVVVNSLERANVRQMEVSHDQRLKRRFIFNLVQSSAPLQDVVTTLGALLAANSINVPSAEAYGPLRDRITTIEELNAVMAVTNGGTNTLSEGGELPIRSEDNAQPIIWVAAEPWVRGSDDTLVSHLLSSFFSYANEYSRFVEQQPFLKAMRSRNLNSTYCTPLLVNAVLALASLYSDAGDDLLASEQYPDRGMQYHEEAMRLWNAEDGRRSVANIQALTILAIDSMIRGKDVLGFTLLNSASTLNNMLRIPEMAPNLSEEDLLYARTRRCAWWTITHISLTYKMGLMLGSDDTQWEDAPDLDQVLHNNDTYWTGPLYPPSAQPVRSRPNLLYKARCQLTYLLWRAAKILIWDTTRLDAQDVHAEVVDRLGTSLREWFDNLPRDLHIRAIMPPGLYDLHTQYFCIQMAIHERVFVRLFGPMSNRPGNGEPLSQRDYQLKEHLRQKTLEYNYGGATCIRHFREAYGITGLSFIQLNHSVIGVFIALNDLHANPPLQLKRPASVTGSINDTQSALEEFFRVLLATSLRWVMSRGFARTASHTAATLDVELPPTIVEMIRLMAGSAWQSSDLEQLDTATYPNWSMPHIRHAHAEQYRMGDMLRQWEGEGGDHEEKEESSRLREGSGSVEGVGLTRFGVERKGDS